MATKHLDNGKVSSPSPISISNLSPHPLPSPHLLICPSPFPTTTTLDFIHGGQDHDTINQFFPGKVGKQYVCPSPGKGQKQMYTQRPLVTHITRVMVKHKTSTQPASANSLRKPSSIVIVHTTKKTAQKTTQKNQKKATPYF